MSRLEDADALLNARLLTDERTFKAAALRCLPLFDLAGHANLPTQDELGLQTARYTTALESVSLSLNKGKARSIHQAAAEDAETYEEGIAKIEAERDAANRAIAELRLQLADSQRRRKNKIEYDGVAKEIGKVPLRGDSKGHIERLTNEINTLLQEQSTYTETWTARKVAYDQIVAGLEALTRTIKEEKAEADRRNALDEDADADGGAEEGQKQLDPNAPEFKPQASKTAGEEGEEMEVDAPTQPSVPPIDAVMAEEKEEGEAD